MRRVVLSKKLGVSLAGSRRGCKGPGRSPASATTSARHVSGSPSRLIVTLIHRAPGVSHNTIEVRNPMTANAIKELQEYPSPSGPAIGFPMVRSPVHLRSARHRYSDYFPVTRRHHGMSVITVSGPGVTVNFPTGDDVRSPPIFGFPTRSNGQQFSYRR
jgi:hypothetical protein